jgi:ribonuclease VapC
MIIDTSALVAILRDEPEAKDCTLAIERNPIRRVSAANFVETALVSPAGASMTLSKKRALLSNPSPKLRRKIAREAIVISGKAADIPPNEFRRLLCLRAFNNYR